MLADELRQRQTSAGRTNAGTSLESCARITKNKTSAVQERPNLLWNNRPEPVVPSYPGSSLSPIKVRERDGIDLSLSQCSPLTFLYPNSTLQLPPPPPPLPVGRLTVHQENDSPKSPHLCRREDNLLK